MIKDEIKMLSVGPEDVLVINLKGEDIDKKYLETFKKDLKKSFPELADRMVIMASTDGIDMAVMRIDGEMSTKNRSMKGVC